MEGGGQADSTAAKTHLSEHRHTPYASSKGKLGKYARKLVFPVAISLRHLLMSKKRFDQWLHCYIKKEALALRRIKVIETLTPAIKIATHLDIKTAFDRNKGLSLKLNKVDPLRTQINNILALKRDPSAMPISFFERVKQKFGIHSFSAKNQQDVCDYLKQIIPFTATPHGLLHISRNTEQMALKGEISKKQLHQLNRELTNQLNHLIFVFQATVNSVDFSLMTWEESQQLLESCHDLALALCEVCPSLLIKKVSRKSITIGEQLKETAINAFNRSVVELKLYGSDEDAKWYLDYSLELMHGLLKSTLYAANTRPRLTSHQLHQTVDAEMREIQSANMPALYRLHKQTTRTAETIALRDARKKRLSRLNKSIKALNGDLREKKRLRKHLRIAYKKLNRVFKYTVSDEEARSVRQEMHTLESPIKELTDFIQSIHKRIQKMNALVVSTFFDLSETNRTLASFGKSARLQFKQLLDAGTINHEDLEQFYDCLHRVTQHLFWPENEIELLLETYTEWVQIRGIEPYEAVHYLNFAIEEHEANRRSGDDKTLDESLFDHKDAMLDYLWLKKVKKSVKNKTLYNVLHSQLPVDNELSMQLNHILDSKHLMAHHIQTLDDFCGKAAVELGLSEKNTLLFLSYFIRWVDEYKLSPEDAVHYLEYSLSVTAESEKEGYTLRDVLLQVNGAIVDSLDGEKEFIRQKEPNVSSVSALKSDDSDH